MVLADGAMITFRCNDGHRLCGPRTLTCVTPPMGKPVWDQALPTCERIPGYVGCFDNEDTEPFLFDLNTEWSDDAMTVEKCISRCSTEGFSFAGLMDGDECYCAKTGLNFTAYGRKRCEDRCEGDATQVCGEDDDQVSVYDVVWYNMVSNAGNGTVPVIG
ncbi:kremen protein 1-like [Lingula anatina]|uniref:Kremen protein 1-like n=1 Tax=Lingula anatina TaxID=7574 RepID=A0A1S3I3F5_LINAN|nr:kremen protein 1-like [Lingula anatina]|eukprot:XP_013392802.1 kremen protein 1-like [Lingula anatina]